jgi:glycosyltransferase involved in cell wall biosynthesis
MKILFIGPYPPPYAGPEMGMKLFLNSSLKDEFQIFFLKTNVHKSNATKGKVDFAAFLAFFRFVFPLLYMIIRYRPTLAYYPVTATQIGWIGRDIWCLTICRVLRVKCVIHLRGSHFRLNYEQFHPLVRRLVRWSCKTVSSAIVQAECLRDQFEGLTPNERIKVLYQAIDTSEYDNPDLDDYQRGKILFLGHLTKAKGYIDLLRCMESVVANGPESHFYCAGTIRKGERNVFFNQCTRKPLAYEDPYIVREEIQSGPLGEHYHELGMITGDDLMEHLRSTDIFVLPSYSEGFSRAMLEAMSVGKPIIYTPVGSHCEVMKHEENGLMCTPGDIGQLSENIKRLLQDQNLRSRIAEHNYRYTREMFDITIVAKELSDIINWCLNDNERPQSCCNT